jgi:hypothetical protein
MNIHKRMKNVEEKNLNIRYFLFNVRYLFFGKLIMEYISTSQGKNIKVIVPIDDYKKMQKKLKAIEKIEKLDIDIEDLVDFALVKKTRSEKSVSLREFFKNEG